MTDDAVGERDDYRTIAEVKTTCWDVLVIGAGAAGLATAIFARQRAAGQSVLLLDGARAPGAKILVSGGSRCNVTNAVVTERDYWGGSSALIRQVLRSFTVTQTVDFFARIGVRLHEEQDGKLFPDSNRSRDVLDALLREAARTGVDLRGRHRVEGITAAPHGFSVQVADHAFTARRVVLATGGQSLPKSGSDGGGYRLAQALGHSLVPTTPALVPLLLAGNGDSLHRALAGVALDATLTLRVDGAVGTRLSGALLWTHFGISGPVVLNMSRHWLRARLSDRQVELTASFVPGWQLPQAEAFWLEESRRRPRATVSSALARLVPGSLAEALPARTGCDPLTPLAQLSRHDRRRMSRALSEWPLSVVDSRGYAYAEATAGGIDLGEVTGSTMESRVCRGLFLVGEILDVDGRLGGFNFQWAWSSALVAARAVSRTKAATAEAPPTAAAR